MKYTHRPFSTVDEMDSTIITRWNEIVHPGSTIYIIGDFAYKDHKAYIHKLNGKKILIVGNHDAMNLEAKGLFTEVHPFLRRKFFGRDITLCHYAMKTWASSCHGAWHLYGHSHGRIKEYDSSLSFDVGIDVWNYYPVPFEIVETKMLLKTHKKLFDSDEAEKHVEENRSLNKVIWDDYVAKSLQTRADGVSG